MDSAILKENIPAIKQYLRQGKNPYLFDGYRRSPMYWAMFYRKKKIVRLFMDIEPEQLDHIDKNGRTVGDWADFYGRPYFRMWISQIHHEKERKTLKEGFDIASEKEYIITDIADLIIDYTVDEFINETAMGIVEKKRNFINVPKLVIVMV